MTALRSFLLLVLALACVGLGLRPADLTAGAREASAAAAVLEGPGGASQTPRTCCAPGPCHCTDQGTPDPDRCRCRAPELPPAPPPALVPAPPTQPWSLPPTPVRLAFAGERVPPAHRQARPASPPPPALRRHLRFCVLLL